jgi:hypothetical protein
MALERPRTGVNGWLLAFCILMTIIRPLFILCSLVNGTRRHALWVAFDFVQMLFGMAVGISLWKVTADAIRLLRFYFGLTAALMVILIGYQLSLGGSYYGIGVFIPIAIWAFYFHTSERVRNTYLTNL